MQTIQTTAAELAAALKAPLHLVSGNHDVGDKKVDWMPAGAVTQACSVLPKAHTAQGSPPLWACTNGTTSVGLEVCPAV